MATDEIEIDFNPDLFNNIFFHIQDALNDDSIRFLWVYGGSSASKTYSVVQECIIFMMQGNDNNTLILRKYATDIKDSIYADFKSIVNDWNLNHLFTFQQNYIKCVSGSYVRFRGLDDSEKVKGISGYTRVVLEEISQFDEVDFKQIKKRLRGKKGQKIIGIFNPISEEHWIKKNVFDKEHLIEVESNISGKQHNLNKEGKPGNTIILKTNYLDNKYIVGPHFIDQHVIDDFEADKENDYAYYTVYGLGNWGRLRTGGEVWKDLNPNIHFKPLVWEEDLALHMYWDDNVNPFLTCLIWQVKKIEHKTHTQYIARQIDEICLEDPRNRVRIICEEFTKRYPPDRVPKLYYGGDRTSMKESTLKEKGENFYTDVANHLKGYNKTFRMESLNPAVLNSIKFVNEVYAGRCPGLSIEIDSTKCKKSVHDYQYALEDSDGSISKKKKTHPVTKVQYEEFGHPSDAKRYFMAMTFPDQYAKYRTGGKKITTKTGKSISKNTY